MPLKPIPPTTRERKRYLLVKVEANVPVEIRELENALINGCLQFLGELGVAKAGILVMADTWNGETIIIKTGHKFVDETKTAISLINSINNKKVRLSIIKVSGTIAKLKQINKSKGE
ncbi:MAG: Rpp14/Pop5 family protein [Candidatus Nanoarchaeia archaeon]